MRRVVSSSASELLKMSCKLFCFCRRGKSPEADHKDIAQCFPPKTCRPFLDCDEKGFYIFYLRSVYWCDRMHLYRARFKGWKVSALIEAVSQFVHHDALRPDGFTRPIRRWQLAQNVPLYIFMKQYPGAAPIEAGEAPGRSRVVDAQLSLTSPTITMAL